jgi:hypothetical protein
MPAALLLISTADTDLLAARASGAGWRVANPARLGVADVPALLDGVDAVVVRLLGGRRTWPKRVAIVLSSYPSKHSRVGNAVGLDTPASAVALIASLASYGYDVGAAAELDGDALIHALIAAGGHDLEWLTEDQLAAAAVRVPLAVYESWFAGLEPALRSAMESVWGPPPGSLYVDGTDIVLAGLRFGNLTLLIQPPRGFGENPIAIYDPELPPSHHYLAAYRWHSGHVDAVVHLGKHGTLEWLPGKGLGLSAGCAPDAVLGDLPLVYPFIVNDPGEGTQAKRRAHATVVDHLVPPMARADTYGDLAKLEQLLDKNAGVQALDPAKLPAVRAAADPSGTTRRAGSPASRWCHWRSSAGRASTSPYASRASSATRSRTSSRCWTRPSRRWRRWTSRCRRTSCAVTRWRTLRNTATNGAPPRGSSAPSRARTAPGFRR